MKVRQLKAARVNSGMGNDTKARLDAGWIDAGWIDPSPVERVGSV